MHKLAWWWPTWYGIEGFGKKRVLQIFDCNWTLLKRLQISILVCLGVFNNVLSSFARFCYVFEIHLAYSKNIGFPSNMPPLNMKQKNILFPWTMKPMKHHISHFNLFKWHKYCIYKKKHIHLYSCISTDHKALSIYFLLWDGFNMMSTLFFPLNFFSSFWNQNTKIAHTVDAAKVNCLSCHQNPPLINKVPEISKGL